MSPLTLASAAHFTLYLTGMSLLYNRETLCFLVMYIVLVEKSPNGRKGYSDAYVHGLPASERSVDGPFAVSR